MHSRIAINLCLVILVITGCTGKSHNGTGSTGNQLSDTGKAVISFTEYEHNFGRVKEGEKIGCIFSYTNTGTSDLVINSATTICGCTVSKYSRKPVPPGSSGTMEVVFDTDGRNGMQSKTITVNSNASKPVVLLKITAEVTSKDKQ
jgi:hypothetical protein